MPEEREKQDAENEKWLGIREACSEYRVTYTWLYRLVAESREAIKRGEIPPLEIRLVETGAIRREVQILRRSLDAWQEKRPERFKKKRGEPPDTERAGRQELAIAG